jgi:acetyl esterase/lipase
MRTLRLSLVGTIILALLAGLAGAALAQSEVPDEDIEWPQPTGSSQYGDDRKQTLDGFEPEPRAEPRPAVIIFHGGALIYGHPYQDAEWAKWLAEQGYVTFMAGYRLFDPRTGEHLWPAQLDDARRAIRWVRAHADEFNVDPERVCAIGHSAGGQLASLLGTTEGADDPDPELAGIPSRADCVVDISGPTDRMVPDPEPDPEWTGLMNELYGGSVEEIPEVWRAASAAHHVDEATVPFLIIHGNLDEDVSIEQSRNLADALAAAGVEYVYAEVPADHFDVLELEATSSLQEAFLADQLHPEE